MGGRAVVLRSSAAFLCSLRARTGREVAVLRMYNAVVGNTRYNIYLIKAITELRKSLIPLRTLIQTHKTALGVNGTKVKSATDSVERLREVLESLRTKR